MASTGEVWKLGHRPALDGVRGVAILLVVVCHVADTRVLAFGGAVGVTLFFVLSGYLITRILATTRPRFRDFFARRMRRLLPALLVLVVMGGGLLYACGSPLWAGYPTQAASALGYVANFRAADMRVLAHTWSLSIEEQFYALWPLLLAPMLRHWSLKTVAHVVTWAAVVAAAWRLLAALTLAPDRVYYMLDTSAFALLMGAAVALREVAGLSRVPSARTSTALTTVGLVGLLGLALIPLSVGWMALVAVGPLIGVAGLCLVAGARHSGGFLTGPVMGWFGRLSYGWYLWHLVVLHLGDADGPWFEDWPMRVFAGVTALGIAYLSYRFIEQPFLRPKVPTVARVPVVV